MRLWQHACTLQPDNGSVTQIMAMTHPPSVCDHLGIITVTGEDAESFLQGQLTSTITGLAPGDNRLAMHLSLKGRAMASFRVIRTATGFDLVTPRGNLEAALKGLAKYALFSKAELAEDTTRQVIGIGDETLARDSDAIRLSGPGEPRWLLLGEAPADSTDGSAWRQQEILAGEAQIYPGGEDLWLPQVLNYDLLEGVHFNKGCYLGQEVVARMHFKGSLKQRMRRWQWPGNSAPATGTVVRNSDGKALGEVVQAVTTDGQVDALVVVRLDHDGELFIDDVPLGATEQALPYTLPADGK